MEHPNLQQIGEFIYKSVDGYYIKNGLSGEYNFHPNEKGFSSNNLLDIINILHTLNENIK